MEESRVQQFKPILHMSSPEHVEHPCRPLRRIVRFQERIRSRLRSRPGLTGRLVAVRVVEYSQDAEEKINEIEVERDGSHDVLVGAEFLRDDVGVVD